MEEKLIYTSLSGTYGGIPYIDQGYFNKLSKLHEGLWTHYFDSKVRHKRYLVRGLQIGESLLFPINGNYIINF